MESWPRTRASRALVALALPTVAMALAHAFHSPTRLVRLPFVEDAFYATSVARNLAMGHGLTIDGVHPTNGFQPLWVFAIAPLFALARGDRVLPLRLMFLASVALHVAFGYALAGLARARAVRAGRDGGLSAGLAWLMALGSYRVFALCENGLETALDLWLLTVAVGRLDRGPPATVRAALGEATLFSLLVYARLDNVFFVALVGLLRIAPAWRTKRLPPVLTLLPCALAAIALVPWLVRNVALAGSLMPTSGRAESTGIELPVNLTVGAATLSQTAFAPLVSLPVLDSFPCTVAAAVTGLAVMAWMIRGAVRERRTVGRGTMALRLFVAVLAGYYTLAFAAPWFLDRYLAAMLVASIPVFASWLEARFATHPGRAVAFGVLIVALNAPFFAASLAGRYTFVDTQLWRPFAELPDFVATHVPPDCVVGAPFSGTLGYFRDGVINLDGKVNVEALMARRAHASGRYIERSPVSVVFVPTIVREMNLPEGLPAFHMVDDDGPLETWVRSGHERCFDRDAAPRAPGVGLVGRAGDG